MCKDCGSEELIKAKLNVYKPDLSPYKSINQQVDAIEKYSHEVTSLLISNVSKVLGLRGLKKSHSDAPLIFKGNIQYNPRTHKPIKKAEWKKLEKAIINYLGIETNEIQRKMVQDSMWLGSILSRMDDTQKAFQEDRKNIDTSEPDFEAVGFKEYDKDEIEIAEQWTGQFLTDISDRARSKINQIITNGVRQKKYKHQIFQELWDESGVINRDWERVIRTETAMNANNGMLITTLRNSDEEHVFMKGYSSPDACPYCLKLVNEKVVVLKESAPSEKDEIKIGGVTYPVIWPGKSNYGIKPKNYWTAITIHPYCRCGWAEWDPELENTFEQYKDQLF